jgi:hypothetical protein
MRSWIRILILLTCYGDTMMTFLLRYTILESERDDCMTLFGGMTESDDRADTGPEITIRGRWSTPGEGSGFCICESPNAKSLTAWLTNWATMATIVVTPVVDDNHAREIILGEKPAFEVAYDRVGDEALDGETLYFIQYRFSDGMKSEGLEAFANLSETDDLEDAGNNTCFGRWHDLGTGSGVAICSSPSVKDVYTWAYRWRDVCECTVTPVVTDSELRSILRGKTEFEAKHAALLEKKKPRARRGYFF